MECLGEVMRKNGLLRYSIGLNCLKRERIDQLEKDSLRMREEENEKENERTMIKG